MSLGSDFLATKMLRSDAFRGKPYKALLKSLRKGSYRREEKQVQQKGTEMHATPTRNSERTAYKIKLRLKQIQTRLDTKLSMRKIN